MPLQSSGQISLLDIATEMGGSAPHSMSEYYSSAIGIPASGTLGMSNFYGKSPLFTGGNRSVADLNTLGEQMIGGNSTNATGGGTLTVDGQGIGSYDYAIKQGNVTVSSFNVGEWFTGTADSRSACIAVNGNLTINGGITFAPSVRKLFTFIYVSGNFTHNGLISMTDRGANAAAAGVTNRNIRIYNGTHGGITNPQIPATGGAGAAGQSNGCPGGPSNPAGAAGTNGGTGGGGGGGNCSPIYAGSGATGSSYVAGGGGGAINNGGTSVPAGNAVFNGGRGGDASTGSISGGAGGGVGNPGGNSHAGGGAGHSGLAGVVIIICKGTISGGGSIQSYGHVGGSGGHASGGSSGGGSINVMYGSSSASWSLNAAGGPHNTSNPYGRHGGSGGNGTARFIAI